MDDRDDDPSDTFNSMVSEDIISDDDQITDNQCTKEELNLSGYDLVTEQTKDKVLLKLKEELQGCKASQANNCKYSSLDNVHY